MPRDKSFDAQFNKLKRELQEAILNNYPNPERNGCPGDTVLRGLAARPLDESVDDEPHWHHVTHCSECYREFLGFRAGIRKEVRARRARIGLLLGAVTVLIIAGVFFAIRGATRAKGRPQNGELAFRRRIVDLEGRAVTRSEEGKAETKPLVLAREPEELTIRLPFGSMEGAYQVQIVRSAGNPLLSASGNAKLENGTTALTAKLDLSKLEPGNYFMCVRRVPWDWTCYPVKID